MNKETPKALGRRGEIFAGDFLIERGFEILAQNYHAQGGELDLLVKHPKEDEYVLVEVKTRSSDLFGDGADSITKSKIRKMIYAFRDFSFKKLRRGPLPYFRIEALVLVPKNDTFLCEYYEDLGEHAYL